MNQIKGVYDPSKYALDEIQNIKFLPLIKKAVMEGTGDKRQSPKLVSL